MKSDAPSIRANQQDIQEMLVAMGFERNYIQRSFKVYEKNYGRRYNVEVLTEIIVRLQNQDKTKQKNKKDQSSLANKLKQQSAPASSQRFPAPQHLKQNLSPNTSPDANGNHYSGYNGNQRHGQHHAHSQSSQIPSNFSQSHFQKGDIVLYQGQQAEVMRVMDNMVEVSYPASQYIMNRRKTTVNPMELQPSQRRHEVHGHSQQYSGPTSPVRSVIDISHLFDFAKNMNAVSLSAADNGTKTRSAVNSDDSKNSGNGNVNAHSQSSQIPSNFSQSHFQKGDIVLYQGQQAEVMRVMDNMVEVSYPASQYIMNRRKKTVDPMELQPSQRRHGVHGHSQQYSGPTSPRNNSQQSHHHSGGGHQCSKSPSQSSMGSGIPSIHQINGTANRQRHGLHGQVDPMRQQQSAPRDKMPSFSSHMTLQDAFKLKIHDKIDHKDQVGRFVFSTVSEKQGTKLKIHHDGWSRKWDTWSDFSQEIHRFAVAGSVSRRPAHRFEHLKKGDYVDINPIHRHPGWKCGEIRRLDQKSGQVQVVYESMDKNYLYWAHLDDEAQIAEFGSNIPHRFVVLQKDPYELLDGLGSGGFGTVYKMKDPKDGSEVAVKKIDLKKMCRKLKKKISEIESVKAMVGTEIQIMRTCRHPNIVQLLNDYYLESKKKICLVMPYYEGGNLRDYIDEHFHDVDAQQFAKQIWKGIEYLHYHNPPIIHRDLKPENILLSEKSSTATLLIADFGTSKFKENAEKETELLTFIGTQDRLAPEMGVKNRPYRSNVDLWNFGLIVCEMVVGPDNFPAMKESGKYNLDKYKVDQGCKTLLSILLERDASKRKWEYVKQNGWLK